MVSIVHSVVVQSDLEQSLRTLCFGLPEEEGSKIRMAVDYAKSAYGERWLENGEPIWSHALGMTLILSGLKIDADCRMAALLFAVPSCDDKGLAQIEERFGTAVARLVRGVFNLKRLNPFMHTIGKSAEESRERHETEIRAQVEILRKMLLAMVEDIRVVLLHLASRTQTLRYFSRINNELRVQIARETFELYAPLANRLGVWELKWEMEDLSFRFLDGELYREIAGQLEEKRGEREQFIVNAVERLKQELSIAGIKNAEVYGRPKHIYSIWSKMRSKDLDFSEVYDVRAMRVIVNKVDDCYAALSVVHNLWPMIPAAFDDYISHPKDNDYQSLHTAVRCADGRSLEVQIRTYEMHRHAELGVAAHWRYKEGDEDFATGAYNEKIAWLRQLLAWKDDVSDSKEWIKHYKIASLDDTIYVMTPQGRVIDLPKGATPVDFAYRVHTDLGHRCRGAKVDGVLVTLNTPLETAQRVEIIATKQGGPSRDWLNPNLKYLATHRAKAKVRQWFSSLALEQSIAEGRNLVMKELQRTGETGMSLDELAAKLGFAKSDDFFVAVARADLNARQLQLAIRGTEEAPVDKWATDAPVRKHPASDKPDKGILIVGIDKLLTQLTRCCKPAPPDPIVGFVTRGKGVSIHRAGCSNFAHMQARQSERVIETDWGNEATGIFAVDIIVDAHDRRGLLRDISDVLAREKINVINVVAASAKPKQGMACMRFTVEVNNLNQLSQTLKTLHEISGVINVRRT